MTHGRRPFLLVPLLALAACQQADVGQPCQISLASVPTPAELWTGNPPCSDPPCGGEYVEFNNTDCENLVCILSPAAPGSKYATGDYANAGYCSKSCISNRDCYQSDTKLVCRNVILDQAFLQSLSTSDPALLDRYLGNIKDSNYCGLSL